MPVRRYLGTIAWAGGFALASACAASAAEPFSLTSSAFKDGTMLAKKNAGANKSNPNCVGENVSPPLAWTNAPAGTVSYALLMVDPEGRAGLGVDHWIAYGIPASVTSFEARTWSGWRPASHGATPTRGRAARTTARPVRNC